MQTVKIYLRSVEVNDEPIHFDVKRIKVFVTHPNKYPLVRLNRLTKEEISKATNMNYENDKQPNQEGKTKSQPITTTCKKRKSEAKDNTYMTRSK